MDRWIELGRLYRSQLNMALTFREALAGLRAGASPGFRARLDAELDWSALTSADLETDRTRVLEWFEDIRGCDLGRGIDIVHVELGTVPRLFELSTWRWADRIMLIDDGLIEPDSIRTVSSPGRVHRASELSSPPLAGLPPFHHSGDLANLLVWLFFCSFVPLEAYQTTDLQKRWGVDREMAVVFSLRDFAFHGGFVTPAGWKRPNKVVEAPGHH